MKNSERRVLILLVVVVAVVVIQVALTAATDRHRSAKLAQIETPPSIAAYQQLAAEFAGKKSSAPVSESKTHDTAEEPVFLGNPVDMIAAYDDLFTRFAQARTDESLLPLRKAPAKWSDTDLANLAEFLLANRQLIEEIRRTAERGGPVYPIDLSEGIGIELPHLMHMVYLARLLCADAVIMDGQGRYSESVASVIAGMQLGDALANEPVIVSQQRRHHIYRIMYEAVERSIHVDNLTPELISRLLDHVDGADNRLAFAESFAGDQILGSQYFTEIGEGKEQYGGFLGRIYGSVVGTPWRNVDESMFIDIMSRARNLAELPYYEAHPQLDRMQEDMLNSIWLLHPLTRGPVIMPEAIGPCRQQAQHEARLDLIQVGLAIEQYQADHGSYPDSLDAIAPQMGWSMPVDPFTGEPYHYYPSADSFQLYSVGSNLVDDGGTPHPGRGDLVWRGREE